MLERLSDALLEIEDHSDDASDYVPEFDAEALEPLFRHLMRTIDLLVRHGGKSPTPSRVCWCTDPCCRGPPHHSEETATARRIGDARLWGATLPRVLSPQAY